MAVKLQLGFEDRYSQGFDQLEKEFAESEAEARKLNRALDEETQALKRMAAEHENAARAMLKSKDASGSMTTTISRSSMETREMSKTTDNAGFSLGGMAGKLGAAAAALKVFQMALSATGKSADGSIDNWVRLRTAAETTWTTAIELTKAAGREVKELVPELEITQKQLEKIAKPWSDAFRVQELELVNKKIADFQNNLRQTMQLQATLREAAALETARDVQKALDAELKRRDEIKYTSLWTEQAQQLSFQMESTLRNRMVQVVEETERRKKEAIERALREEAEARRKALEQEERMLREALAEEQKIREEAAEHRRRIEETHAEERRNDAIQIERNDTDYWKDRMRRAEVGEEKITEMERESAKRRHKIRMEGAKSEEETIRLKHQLERELRDIDHRAELEAERAAHQMKVEAAQREVDLEREKIEKIKALRDESGKNLFEQEMAKQSPEATMDALIQKRLAESREEQPDLSRHARMQMDRFIRRATAQGKTTSGEETSPEEIARVQSDLASNTILAADKQGKLNNETLKAFAEQAKTMKDQTNFNEEISKQLQEVQKAQEGQRKTTREQTERLRAQRRAMRG